MRVAVCDSCGEEAGNLKLSLSEYFYGWPEPVSIYEYHGLDDLLCDLPDELLELLFFAAPNDRETLIEETDRIWERDFRGRLILVGNSMDIAFYGYEADASAFLPYDHTKKQFYRILNTVTRAHRGAFTFRSNRRIFSLDYNEIVYVECCGTYCEIHTRRGESYRVNQSISEISDRLGGMFLRCHQSYIVNMSCVVSVDRDFHLINGAAVPIRQHDLRNVKKTFLEFERSIV